MVSDITKFMLANYSLDRDSGVCGSKAGTPKLMS